jgi:hypothetical protein
METDKVLWDGSASLGTDVFKLLNLEDDATLDTENDSTYGLVWKFTKPEGSNRAEVHAAKNFQADEGQVIYLGWRFKVSMPDESLRTNAFFQWKTYPPKSMPKGSPAGQQNYPVVLKSFDGKFVLMQKNPDDKKTNVWEAPITLDTWNSVVLGMGVSRDITKGWIEFWFNGQQQTLSNGSTRFVCRTLDDEGCQVDPKWGIYGAKDDEVITYVASLKIAATYEAAAP